MAHAKSHQNIFFLIHEYTRHLVLKHDRSGFIMTGKINLSLVL